MTHRNLLQEVIEVIRNNWDAIRSPDAQMDTWDEALRQLFPDYHRRDLRQRASTRRHQYTENTMQAIQIAATLTTTLSDWISG